MTARSGKTGCAGKLWLVDDDFEDAELIRRALSEREENWECEHFIDGEAFLGALDESSQEGGEPPAFPDAIVLDLNMPLLNGREVLARLKSDFRYSQIPVVVLSSSRAEGEMRVTKELGAELFVFKPESLQGFREAAEQIRDHLRERLQERDKIQYNERIH